MALELLFHTLHSVIEQYLLEIRLLSSMRRREDGMIGIRLWSGWLSILRCKPSIRFGIVRRGLPCEGKAFESTRTRMLFLPSLGVRMIFCS